MSFRGASIKPVIEGFDHRVRGVQYIKERVAPGRRLSLQPEHRVHAHILDQQFIAAMVAEKKLMTDFSAAEVIGHATRVPGAYLLRATLRDLGADKPRRLGKVLQRLEGVAVDGWAVRRVARDAAGTIWRIEPAM